VTLTGDDARELLRHPWPALIAQFALFFGGGFGGGYGPQQRRGGGDRCSSLLVRSSRYAISFLLLRALSRYVREFAARPLCEADVDGAPQRAASAAVWKIADDDEEPMELPVPSQDLRKPKE